MIVNDGFFKERETYRTNQKGYYLRVPTRPTQ
ncbi:hypothetical protein FIU82_06150 [Pseudoalteromonas sp. THAF3]|nr:hypothetical protein FIU82_06150 [Pseudoalteromonas sp. THAF3]